MRPRRFDQTRSKIEKRWRAFFKARLSSIMSSRLASWPASQANSKAFSLAFPLCLFFLNTAHGSVNPPSEPTKISQENPNLSDLAPRRLASSPNPSEHILQNQCAELIESHSTISRSDAGLGSGSSLHSGSDSSTDRQNIYPQTMTLQQAAPQSRTIHQRLTDDLNEIISNVENRFVEPTAAADTLTALFTREFLFDYQDFVSRSLRLPKIVNDHKENGLLMQTAQDYASTVDKLNEAIEAYNELDSSSVQGSTQNAGQNSKSWPLRLAAKLAPKYFDRVQNNAKATQYNLASALDKKADETIENARTQHEDLLTRIEENQEALKELNFWLARINQEYSLMGQMADELKKNKSQRTDRHEQDQLELTLARVQSIRQDLLQKEAELRGLRTSRLALDESNKEASTMFSDILTLKRRHFEREINAREITINANGETALQVSDKNNRLMAREEFNRPLPEGTRIASISDLQRPLVVGEEVFLASKDTFTVNGFIDYDVFHMGQHFWVVGEQKSYFLTINPFRILTPVFSTIAQITRGNLPEPISSSVRVRYRKYTEGTTSEPASAKEYVWDIPRQALAISAKNLIYSGFRVGDLFNGTGSIHGRFSIHGFTYWGNILVRHERSLIGYDTVTTWQVYSPKKLRKLIQDGVLVPHSFHDVVERK